LGNSVGRRRRQPRPRVHRRSSQHRASGGQRCWVLASDRPRPRLVPPVRV